MFALTFFIETFQMLQTAYREEFLRRLEKTVAIFYIQICAELI